MLQLINRYDTRDSEDNHSDNMPLQIVLNYFMAQMGLSIADAHLNSDNSCSADKVHFRLISRISKLVGEVFGEAGGRGVLLKLLNAQLVYV